MQISVIIPTHQRPAKLAACLRALAAQTLDGREYEVLVGFDGGDAHGTRAAADAWKGALEAQNPGAGGGALQLIEVPRCGITNVRNHLLARASGRVMLSTNDDVIPDPRLLEAHAREHEAASGRGTPVIVSGSSPWVVHQPDRLFDRLVRETSMVFFHDRMIAAQAEPMRDWGYRHAWGLNMSAPMDLVREVGGFTVFPAWYGYEDNELSLIHI